MSAYVDSALLIKLYVPEPDSARAFHLIGACPPPLPLTALQELEVRNAIHLKHARNEIDAYQLTVALQDLDSDIRGGPLKRKVLNWPDAFSRAAELSESHTVPTFCRTLDILHVAIALLLRIADFLTWDNRQAALARAVGLNVLS